MNLLEIYIKEIHGYTILPSPDDTDNKYISVDVTTNCHGCINRQVRLFPLAEWERIKEQGYWLG